MVLHPYYCSGTRFPSITCTPHIVLTHTSSLYMYILTYSHTHTHTHTRTHSYARTHLAPPKKKQKREKKSKTEKIMENTSSFIKYQAEAEKREEERWRKEMELEETWRREDQQHELHMMQMLGQMHRCRKMLKVGGALNKVARVARAKILGHAHFSLKPRPFCVHDALSKSLLVEAMKKWAVDQNRL